MGTSYECELKNIDGFDLLANLPEGSVDLILSDQPYETTKLHFDKQPIDYNKLFDLSWRALKPTGWLILFGRGTFVGQLIQMPEFIFERVWFKSRKTLGHMKDYRPLIQHEWIMHFNRTRMDGTFNPQKSTGHEPKGTWLRKESGSHWNKDKPSMYEDTEGTRYPTTVMEYDNPPKKNGVTHPTSKPLGLIKELVLTHTNEGELVVDPFNGGDSLRASTAEAAYLTNRRFLGAELTPSTFKASKGRLDALKAQPRLFG